MRSNMVRAAFAVLVGIPAWSGAAWAQGGGQQPTLQVDLSFIAEVSAAWFSTPDNLQTGAHDPARNGFVFQQLEMAVGAAVDPWFRFDGNLVFSPTGVEIEEAYGTTLALPGRFQLRFGQFLTRFGRFNNSHPHAWKLVDQPFAVGRVFGAEGGRGAGAELSVLLPLPWYVELLGSATMANGEATARSFYGPVDLGVRTPADLVWTAALKQFFELNADWSLLWGLSWATGPNGSGRANRSELYGTDLFIKWRPIASGRGSKEVSLHTEWIYRRRQIPDDAIRDISGFAELWVRFAPRWGAVARWELGTPAKGLNGILGKDPLDPDWIAARHRVTAGLGFMPTEFSRFRLQGSVDLAPWRDRPTVAVFLTAELSVGAHGAHKF